MQRCRRGNPLTDSCDGRGQGDRRRQRKRTRSGQQLLCEEHVCETEAYESSADEDMGANETDGGGKEREDGEGGGDEGSGGGGDGDDEGDGAREQELK